MSSSQSLSYTLGRAALSALGMMPNLGFNGPEFAFHPRSASVRQYIASRSFMLLRTLLVALGLHALQFKPAPIQELVCEDGDQNALEYWSASVLVKIALLDVSIVSCIWNVFVDRLREGCPWAPRIWAALEAAVLTVGGVGRQACGA